MPYLQVDLDAKRRMPAAAAHAGIDQGRMAWGLLSVWEECWQEKNDTITTGRLAGHFATDGRRVASALVEFGFLEATGTDTFRVRGSGRYLRISKARSEAGKKGAAAKHLAGNCQAKNDESADFAKQEPGNCQANGWPLHRAPNTEHREESSASQADADAPPAPWLPPGKSSPVTGPNLSPETQALLAERRHGDRRQPPPEPEERPPLTLVPVPGEKPPRKRSDQEVFAEYFEAERRAALGPDWVPDKKLGVSRLNVELAWVREEPDQLVCEAVALYLADPKRREQDPPCQLLWFAQDRHTYLSRARRALA